LCTLRERRDDRAVTHLTHGWERDLDPGDTLLRRFVMASADRAETLSRLVGGRVHRTPAFSASDPASPVLFDNAAVLLQPPSSIDLGGVVGELLDWYPPERHFALLSAFATPDLTPHGLMLMGHPPFMFRPAGGTAPPPPPDLVIREVADEHDLRTFVETIVAAYPMPGAESAALADARVLDSGVRLFVGYVDGVAVGTAGAWVGDGLNDVEWVSSRSEYRRRGIGAALTWAATLAEPAFPAALIASDDGQAVYEAMGYVRLLRLTIWHRPPAA
jgi:GNAT superfamily N-acetyltransferase